MENKNYDEKLFNEMWDRLVPVSGEAETVRGEVLRCAARLEYESFNNGNCNAYDTSYNGRNYYDEMRGFLRKYGIQDAEVDEDYRLKRTSYEHNGYGRLVAKAIRFVKQREE